MASRILVTGGAGLIGSHLCERLLRQGHAVLCLDDLSTGSLANLAPLLDEAGFAFLRRDVTEPFPVGADLIYNLACPASPAHYQRDPVRTTRISVLGALNVLDLAARTGTTVLQASTSEVYGDPLVHPQPETYRGNVDPVGPRACYDEGKRCAETLFLDHHRRHGVPVKVARIFNTYGPRMRPDDGRVVSNFVVQALRGRPLTVRGSGGQTRAFCYVDDLVEGLERLMATGPAVTGPINLGNPEEVTILALAELVVALTGSRSRIVHAPPAADDPGRRCPDVRVAGRTLGWAPAVPLREGLARTIAYFDALLSSGGESGDDGPDAPGSMSG